MLIRTDTLQPWAGETLANGITYPISIEQLWADADLNAIGLVRMKPFTTPAGSEIIGPPTYAADGTQTYPTQTITAAELAAQDQANGQAALANPRLAKLLLMLTNQMLTAQGKSTITMAQFLTWLMTQ